jgi:hypothetical protein
MPVLVGSKRLHKSSSLPRHFAVPAINNNNNNNWYGTTISNNNKQQQTTTGTALLFRVDRVEISEERWQHV